MNLMHDYSILQAQLNVQFIDASLLVQAFTHRSYLNEFPGKLPGHNERLEYLGDAVLELVATHYLYLRFPDTPEGQLTAYRSAIVRTETISLVAGKLGFNEYLLLSKGEARDTGKARSYILANTFEAFVGALYLDQGYDSAKDFIITHLMPEMDIVLAKGLWRDAKSYVQEKAQEVFQVTPTYEVLSETGPDHDRVFTVGIFFGERKVAIGAGTSKQEAQQEAARSALEIMSWGA